MPLHDQVICGDSREVLKGLPDGYIDAVCTDPPYALLSSRNGTTGFMNQKWDNGQVAHDPAFWAEVLRVARPGAFLLAFGGTRTYHRLVCAIEDAGWECRDMLTWLYGSGFPKSKSCLKPAHEPILLAKAPGPLQPLQIDAARIPTAEDQGRPRGTFPHSDDAWGNGHLTHTEGHTGGRWPPNTLLSHHPSCVPAGVRRVRGITSGPAGPTTSAPSSVLHGGVDGSLNRRRAPNYADADGYETLDAYQCVDGCPVAALDEQAGPRTSGVKKPHHRRHAAKGWSGPYADDQGGPAFRSLTGGDTGACSRFFTVFPPETPDPEDAVPFFYAPKAPRSERRLPDGTPTGHPTQKPLLLCQWLVTLCCPPGGTCLDPFAGVASVGVGALRAGRSYIGIEQDERYAAAGRARLAAERERQSGPLFATAEKDA